MAKITSGMAMTTHLAMALVGGIITAAVIAQCGNPTWHDNPRPLQSGVQPADPQQGGVSQHQRLGAPTAVLDGLAGCFQADAPVAVECLEQAPRCPHEDGDPSGWPCLWVDPGTGSVWFIDSHEYWD